MLPPHPDELLSSWISRHTTFYAVPPFVILRHCLPEVSSLRAADLRLTEDQEIRLASMFATKPTVVRRMTITNVAQSSRRLIAARPMQCCTNCNPDHIAPAAGPILRSSCWGGASPVLFAEICSATSTDAYSPPPSVDTTGRLFVVKGCLTPKRSAASEPGHRRPKSPGSSRCGERNGPRHARIPRCA
ncbi:TniQ family protein [Mesorhizobium abyssinicae]